MLAVIVAVFAGALIRLCQQEQPKTLLEISQHVPIEHTAAADIRYSTISDGDTRTVHAPTLALYRDQVIAAWWGGTREGHSDVHIFLDRTPMQQDQSRSSHWSVDQLVMTAEQTGKAQGRYVRKLGNPVLASQDGNNLVMLYVSVSLGGWATSALNVMESSDGEHFGAPRRLVTSPWFNLSTLVKSAPLQTTDGHFVWPVYHEFAGKFAELLHLSSQGDVLDKHRITSQRYSLQPVLFSGDNLQLSAWMRYAGDSPGRIVGASQDSDGNWQPKGKGVLPNPNSAITGLRYNTDYHVMVLNDTEDGRNRLGLFLMHRDGMQAHRLYYFEDQSDLPDRVERSLYRDRLMGSLAKQGVSVEAQKQQIQLAEQSMCVENIGCRFQFDYPYLIQAPDGVYHLAYTWNKSVIRHVAFNRAWVEQQIQLHASSGVSVH